MNVTCSHCSTVYRVDPSKIPAAGVRARCSRCGGIIAISAPQSAAVAASVGPGSAEVSAPTPAPAFGAVDPGAKARRLARALISDIVVYHPERREQSMREGTLRHEFREEIRKSWDEYLSQVGGKMARETPYFRDALNEVLAGGSPVF